VTHGIISNVRSISIADMMWPYKRRGLHFFVFGSIMLAVHGCASHIQLSPAGAKLRSNMSESQAHAIVESALKPDGSGRGGARGAKWSLTVPPVYPTDIKVVGRAIEYLSPGPDIDKGDTPEEGCTTVKGNLESTPDHTRNPTVCRRRIALDDLWQVRVSDEQAGPHSVAGFSVNIQESVGSSILVNIPRENLEPLLAALSFYSPKAALRQGVGF